MSREQFLTVGGKRFHYIWLRDNCLCRKCRHSTSFQKLIDLTDRPSPPEPDSVVQTDTQLKITWKENPPHESIFPISWLLERAYDRPATSAKMHRELELLPREKLLWDRAGLEANLPQWQDASGDRSIWTNQLFTLGFTFLRNMALKDLDAFVSKLGTTYEQGRYGRFSTVKAVPGAEDLSLSPEGHTLSPHTDATYMHAQRLVQFLYCVENSASGGESVLVDGFRVAQDFRQNHPEDFQILASTPVEFRQFFEEWEYFFSHKTTILNLEPSGEVARIYFSHKNFNVDIPFDQMEGFYQAYGKFFGYLKNPAYQYWYRLEPGDCMIVQNFRVLHGRKAFEPHSGMRHLEVAYMPWEYFTGRENFHQVKYLYLH